MKYLVVFFSITIFLTVVFFLRPKIENTVGDEVTNEKIVTQQNKGPLLKSVDTENKMVEVDQPKIINNIDKLNKLGQEIIDEVSECERKFDETLSVPMGEISSIDNQSLIYVLEEFDEMKLSSPKLGELMGALSMMESSKLSQNKNLVDNLSLVRPCRPFEKINFINELMKRYKDNENDDFFRKKIKSSVRIYLNKELKYSVNLSTVNMLSNVVMSLLDEGVFDDSLKDSCESLIEDLENDFDDLVDLAEETLEDDNLDFDSSLLRKEIILSQKYKKRLLDIIQKI